MYIVPVFVPHAGCPHTCSFCNQRTISGQSHYTTADIQRQLTEFADRLPRALPKQVAFYGGSFTAIAEQQQLELLEYAQAQAEKYNIVSLRVSTRPDCIDERALKLLKDHKVEVIELGVQSLDDAVLTAAQRGHTAAVVAPAAALIKAYGIQLGIQLMVGMPGQSFESVLDTTERVLALQPDLVRIYSLMVLRQTQLEQDYLAGRFVPLSLAESVRWAHHIWSKMQEHGIKVIRMGLQAEEALHGQIVAGEYHPAFGELVLQYHYRLVLERMLSNRAPGNILLRYPKCIASQIVGLRQSNKQYLAARYPLLKIKWQAADIDAIEVGHQGVAFAK